MYSVVRNIDTRYIAVRFSEAAVCKETVDGAGWWVLLFAPSAPDAGGVVGTVCVGVTDVTLNGALHR